MGKWGGPVGWLAVALALCSAACNAVSTPTGVPTSADEGSCSTSGEWTVEFRREGGIMGRSQSLELTSAGNLVVQDLQTQKLFTKTLDTTQLSIIDDQLAQACPFETRKTEQTCADCFFYDLTFKTDGARYQAQVTDLSISPDLQPLIQTLTGLLDETIVR